jgi:hypothetical protein
MKSGFKQIGKLLLVIGYSLLMVSLSGCLLKRTEETSIDENATKENLTPASEMAEPTTAPSASIPLEGRPYVTLIPRADGKELNLSITGIVDAKTLEYELTYLAGDPNNQLQRGVVGSVDLAGKTDYQKAILLGSCSKNVCKYDEGVTEGTLALTLRSSEGAIQKYESAFHLQKGSEGKAGLTSGEGNFKLVSANLPAAYYLTLSTIGLFQTPSGKIIAGPYGVFTSASSRITGQVSLRLAESSSRPSVYVWQNKQWQKLTSGLETDGEVVSVSTDRLGTFVAVEE